MRVNGRKCIDNLRVLKPGQKPTPDTKYSCGIFQKFSYMLDETVELTWSVEELEKMPNLPKTLGAWRKELFPYSLPSWYQKYINDMKREEPMQAPQRRPRRALVEPD